MRTYYTTYKIYELVCQAGQTGSEGSIHNFISQRHNERKQKDSYLSLDVDLSQVCI